MMSNYWWCLWFACAKAVRSRKSSYTLARTLAASVQLIMPAILTTSVGLAESAITGPFFQSNRNPFVSVFGLPPAETARLLPSREQLFSLVLEVANSFSDHNAGSESIQLDGETTRTTLVWRVKLAERLEVGLDFPWVHHGGGHFDPLIAAWHRLLGIPAGERGSVPDNRFHFAYYRDRSVQLDSHRAAGGIGDIRLVSGWQLLSQNGRWLALRGGLKLPTGDPDRLFGSGSTDGNIGICFRDEQSLPLSGLVYEIAGGILATSDGDIVPAYRRNTTFYGSSHLAVPIVDWFAFKIQLDGHGALYNSQLRELGKGSAQLTMGTGIAFRDRWAASFAVAQEIIVDAAPDVVFFFSIRYRLESGRRP